MSRIKKAELNRSVPLMRLSLTVRLSSEDLHPLNRVCFPFPSLDGFGFGELVFYCVEILMVSNKC